MNRVKSSSSRGAWAAVFLALITTVSSFGTIQPVARVSTHRSITTTQLSAVTPKPYDPTYKSKPPTFNKETSLWEPSSETETAYGPWGSFLRGGPNPFLVRVLTPDDYDQAVFKYMAQVSCSRIEAQGNMDAYFNNAADWAYQKSEEARGRPMVDYTELKLQSAVLVIAWALFVTPFIGRIAYLIAFGDKGWDVSLDDIFTF